MDTAKACRSKVRRVTVEGLHRGGIGGERSSCWEAAQATPEGRTRSIVPQLPAVFRHHLTSRLFPCNQAGVPYACVKATFAILNMNEALSPQLLAQPFCLLCRTGDLICQQLALTLEHSMSGC